MITIRGKQYHEYPIINKDAVNEARCLGCSFLKRTETYCDNLMRELETQIQYEGCGNVDVVFVLDNKKHIARYVALRMGAKDE